MLKYSIIILTIVFFPFLIQAQVLDVNGDQTVGAEEAINVLDAIRVYTWNGAFLSKDEDKLGSIEPGKLADIIIIDKDILTIPEEEILNIQVLKTIVDGKIIYSK